MSYTYAMTCDNCGKSTEPKDSKAKLRSLCDQGGWLQVRHTGKHYCRSCRCEHEQKAKRPRPTFEQRKEVLAAEKRTRLEVAGRLRANGLTYKQVGDALGVSATRAAQMCKALDQMTN